MPVTLITVSSGCFLSVETFCVNGRAHATPRRRFLLHFPGNDEPRVGAFAFPELKVIGPDLPWGLQRFGCAQNGSPKWHATYVRAGRCGVWVSRPAREVRSMLRH